MANKMRLGMFVPQGWRLDLVDIDPADQWQTMLRLAQRAEAGPWESIWVYDHFHTTPEPTDQACHEAWTLMAAYAAATKNVRLGQMCTCMSYRNPAYLAKIAASTDVISGGRVEMGIGAGWYEHEWRAFGYGFPRAGERLARLDEGIQIMRELWTTGRSTFAGEHYQTDGAISQPLPLQDGGIPLWVAGGGEKVTLRIAAKHARGGTTDNELVSHTAYTNFLGILDSFKHKSEVLARHCSDLGTDFDSITRSSNFNTIIGETAAEVDDKINALGDLYRRFLPEEKVAEQLGHYRRSPTTGTPEQVVENLTEFYDAGLRYAICYHPQIAHDTSSLDLFEAKVVPQLP